MNDVLAGLPSEKDNYDVWCERCQRVHPYYTMTREKMQGILNDGARKIAERIDAKIAADLMAGRL